jgi:hypothetical protein
VRIFVVVAKSRGDLYQYFAQGLAGISEIEVILDRRIGPHSPPGGALGAQADNRRLTRNIYEELEHRGFVIVRLPSE